MTSLHYRSASATDRRSTNFSSGPSRINSTRAREHDRPSARDSGSPLLPDGFGDSPDGTHKHSRNDSRLSGLERRREKSTVTTTETILTRRSPKKDSSNSDARKRDQKHNAASPSLRRTTKDGDDGELDPLTIYNISLISLQRNGLRQCHSFLIPPLLWLPESQHRLCRVMRLHILIQFPWKP